jgi:hypothetical protein
MKRKYVVIGIIAAAVVIVVIGAMMLLSNINSVVKGVIEHYGTEVTGTTVSVAAVNIDIKSGRGTIRGFAVASPDGYSSKDAFRLGEISVQIDVKSLTQKPIVLSDVRIVAPEVNYELNAKGKSNIDVIKANVERFQGGSPTGSADAKNEQARLRIAKFTFENGTIHGDAQALGGGKTDIELPAIHLTDVGGAAGETPDRVAKIVTTAFVRQVTEAAAAKGIEKLVKDKLGDKVGNAAKDLLKKLGN